MNKLEQRTAASLAAVYSVRMLGLYDLIRSTMRITTGITPLIVNFSIVIYSLIQETLQITLGLLSNKIGRKLVIVGTNSLHFR